MSWIGVCIINTAETIPSWLKSKRTEISISIAVHHHKIITIAVLRQKQPKDLKTSLTWKSNIKNPIIDDLNYNVYSSRMLQMLTIDKTTHLHQNGTKSVLIRNIVFFFLIVSFSILHWQRLSIIFPGLFLSLSWDIFFSLTMIQIEQAIFSP